MLVVISVAVLMSRESEPVDMQLTVEFTYSRDMPDAQVACDSVKHPNQELVYCEIDQGDGVAMMTMALFDVHASARHRATHRNQPHPHNRN